MSPLNSSFDQTKCNSSCFQRCFSHHKLKLKKTHEEEQSPSRLLGGCRMDWCSLSGLVKISNTSCWGKKNQLGLKCEEVLTPWIIYSVKVCSIITEKLWIDSLIPTLWPGWGKLAWYVKKSLNEVNYELSQNEREPEWEANKKSKSSACCGLSVCRDSIVTHWAVHFYRASQLPEAPRIVWPAFWHQTQALTAQLAERILTFYWQTEESWRDPCCPSSAGCPGLVFSHCFYLCAELYWKHEWVQKKCIPFKNTKTNNDQ